MEVYRKRWEQLKSELTQREHMHRGQADMRQANNDANFIEARGREREAADLRIRAAEIERMYPIPYQVAGDQPGINVAPSPFTATTGELPPGMIETIAERVAARLERGGAVARSFADLAPYADADPATGVGEAAAGPHPFGNIGRPAPVDPRSAHYPFSNLDPTGKRTPERSFDDEMRDQEGALAREVAARVANAKGVADDDDAPPPPAEPAHPFAHIAAQDTQDAEGDRDASRDDA